METRKTDRANDATGAASSVSGAAEGTSAKSPREKAETAHRRRL